MARAKITRVSVSTRDRAVSDEPPVSGPITERDLDSTATLPDTKPSKTPKRKTVTRQDMPAWCCENEFIIAGYRKLQNSYRGCASSLFYIHNESGNIYTHLIGAVAFLITWIATYFAYIPLLKSADNLDYLIMSVFVFGAITCLTLSTLYHLFSCHSFDVAKKWNRMDYVGIVVLIVASFYPAAYYGFYCHPHIQAIYLSVQTVLGLVTMFITASKRSPTPEFRLIRTGLFLLLGFSAIIPSAHAIILYGFMFTTKSMSIVYLFMMGAQYVLGSFIYVKRVPERWYPGKFDILLHSHQIFHILVLSAAYTHWVGSIKSYSFWHSMAPTKDQVCALTIEEMTRFVDGSVL